ncbi:MAG: hypothetical protein LH474_01995 [Chamaesiphon sp.]|nr:hypothetical protein [Chamaesiphon sp.]
MTPANSVLIASLNEIKDAISDFRNSSVPDEADNTLKRIVSLFGKEPLDRFLTSVLPSIDFETWREESIGNCGIQWPINMDNRVAIQVELCREIERSNHISLINFIQEYCGENSGDLPRLFRAFTTKILDPLVRDISRLIELRPVSPILLDAMRSLPISGDETLDELLQEACRKFKDPTPQSLQDATEKLWDSWERIKSLENPENKKNSVKLLLDRATNNTYFYNYLDQEAKALTDIGNQFQLRHFEVGKQPLTLEQLEYLFHRLYSLIRFLLLARTKNS